MGGRGGALQLRQTEEALYLIGYGSSALRLRCWSSMKEKRISRKKLRFVVV